MSLENSSATPNTEPTTPVPPVAPETAVPSKGSFDVNDLLNIPHKRWATLGVVSALLMIFGSFGPWVTLGPLSASGTDGDGVITLFLALGAIAVLVFFLTAQGSRLTWLPWLATGMGALAALVALVDMSDFESEETLFGTASLGWGIILVGIAAVALTVESVLSALAARKAGTV